MITAGIDVGGAKKGFHAVALRGPDILDCFTSTDPEAMAAWCTRIGARAVGVDAPSAWSMDGRARPAERSLMRAGVHCFASPTRAAALAHPKNWFGWMFAGEALYRALRGGARKGAGGYRLLGDGLGDGGGAAHALIRPPLPVVFETFPQAIACALVGRHVPARDKVRVRGGILRDAGIDTRIDTGIDAVLLAGIDFIDAALCALAAQHLAAGSVRLHGEAGDGFIALPLGRTAVDARLIRAYRAAHYGVEAEGGQPPLTLRVDCASDALVALHRRHRVTESAYITACNPASRVVADTINRRRMAMLARDIAAAGRVVIPGQSVEGGAKPSARWPAEPSFLVPGLTEPEARTLATRHGQNAVLHAGRDGVPRLVMVR
jgi:predicted nuclease with RNAse H fold